MSDSDPQPSAEGLPILRFPLKPPPRLSQGLIGLSVLAGLFSWGTVGTLMAQEGRVLEALGVVAMVVVLPLLVSLLLRRPGPGSMIELHADKIHLPLSAETVIPVRYGEVNLLFVRESRAGFLMVGTLRGNFSFPLSAFVSRDDARLVEAGIRDRVAALLPDGVERVAIFDRQRDEAARTYGRPTYATQILLLVLVVIFGLEMAGGATREMTGYGLVRFGAGVRALIVQGEWWRLVTANYLHANLVHVVLNGLAILSLGGVVERLLGTRGLVLVWCLSSITGAGASAISNRAELSIGASTAAFGLLGALAFTAFRYKARMPAGLRPPLRWWIWIGLVNGLLTLIVPVIDVPAHLGGFLGGVLVSALVLDGDPALPLAGPQKWGSTLILIVLVFVHSAGIGLGLRAYAAGDEAARQTLMRHGLEAEKGGAIMLNLMAWEAATEASTTPARLEIAKQAAERALSRIDDDMKGESNVLKKEARAEVQDTLATLEYRLGNLDRAVALERQVLESQSRPVYATQLARFLEARDVLGTRSASVSLELVEHAERGFGLIVRRVDSSTRALSVLALVRGPKGLEGLIQIGDPRLLQAARPDQPIWLEAQGIHGAWSKSAKLEPVWSEPGPGRWRAWSMDPKIIALP